MIVLDTHIWIWWVHGDARLTTLQVAWLEQYESQGLGVSAISCWEVAKLVEYKRLVLPCPVDAWMDHALTYPGIRLTADLDLTPQIAIESTRSRKPANAMAQLGLMPLDRLCAKTSITVNVTWISLSNLAPWNPMLESMPTSVCWIT